MRIRFLVLTLVVAATATAVAQRTTWTSGFDPAQFDSAVRPQDDLYAHVNGRWLAETVLEPTQAFRDTFVDLTDRVEIDLRRLLDELASADAEPGSTARTVGHLYASFLSGSAADPSALQSRLAEIDAIGTTDELAALIARMMAAGLPGPIKGFVDADAQSEGQHALYLSQGGTSLPSRDHYMSLDEPFATVRNRYREYLVTIARLAGRPNPVETAATVFDVEASLARLQWTDVESRDIALTYNRYDLSELEREMPGFAWTLWARTLGWDRAPVVVIAQPSFFAGFAEMVDRKPLEAWKHWLAAQLITMHAPHLGEAIAGAAFEVFGRALNHQDAPPPRWKSGVQLMNSLIGDGLGELYVGRYFTPETRVRVRAITDNLLEAYRRTFTENAWMTARTREQALDKLSRLRVKIAHPDDWRDYGAIEIETDDLLGNIERVRRFEHAREAARLGQPIDPDAWVVTPQAITALYNPVMNEVVFPAALLQPPFFDVEADDALNYGAIGAIIAHEIAHAFDDQGSRFDGRGRVNDWWTDTDETAFYARADVLVEQFSTQGVMAGLPVNGAITIGESLADLAGLAIAHRAYRIAMTDRTPPVIDGLTGDQRFFMGWVQAWRQKASVDYLRSLLANGPQPPARLRANVPLSNMAAFYAAFKIEPGNAQYVEPRKRVQVW